MGRPKKEQQEENERLLVYVRRFKESQDPEAFAMIAKVMEGYFQHLTFRKFFYVPGNAPDDLYQEALVALATKAIPDYVEEKGPFVTFAKLCVRRHIITILKSASNNRHGPLNTSVSIDAPVSESGEDDEGPMTVGGFISNGQEGIVEKLVRGENFKGLRRTLLSRLTSLEALVLDLYLKNLSYFDIVNFMNKRRRGRNRVGCKTIDNALCRIKKKAVELIKSHKIEVPPRKNLG
jgi:RNA polymerase sporulation-specific sigma factor